MGHIVRASSRRWRERAAARLVHTHTANDWKSYLTLAKHTPAPRAIYKYPQEKALRNLIYETSQKQTKEKNQTQKALSQSLPLNISTEQKFGNRRLSRLAERGFNIIPTAGSQIRKNVRQN